MKYFNIVESPIDPLMIVSDGEFLTGLFMDHPRYGPAKAEGFEQDKGLPVLRETQRQLNAFFAGELREFDLPLRGAGTEFQNQVWGLLRTIPFGQTWSYRELAKRTGDSKASRAVGAANGRNPIAVIVPCHRVIGADGSLTGFGGGLPRKAKLLGFERAMLFGETAQEYWSGALTYATS
jgi:methylated-DNA-[protein]-cysteine S-methyltransferase